MATFSKVTDTAGAERVRCHVKGAAPAVLGRVSSALSDGSSVPWDDSLRARAEENMQRMGEEGLRDGCRLPRHRPAGFDPSGDLLAHVEGLEMTSLVAMVDPPREESEGRRPARSEAPSGCGW